jgi:hypothetical protein
MGFQHIMPWNSINQDTGKFFDIQSGEVSLTGETQTAVIATIDTTKAVLEFSYESSDTSANANDNCVRGNVNSATEIEFKRHASGGTITIRWFIWEAKPSTPMTVQRFDIQTGNSVSLPVNTSITAIDLAHSFLLVSTRCDTTDSPKQNNIAKGKFTSTTNLEMDMNLTTSAGIDSEVQVVENTDWDVQSGDVTIAGTSGSDTLSPAIALADSYAVGSGNFDQSVLDGDEILKIFHDSTTTINFDRPNSSGEWVISWFVADTNGDFFTQHNQMNILSGNTSVTITTTETDVTKTFLKVGSPLMSYCPITDASLSVGDEVCVKLELGSTPATEQDANRDDPTGDVTASKAQRFEILT